MDITTVGTIVGLFAAFYAIFFGKGMVEFYQEQKKRIELSKTVDTLNNAVGEKVVINNLRRTECIGRIELIEDVVSSVKSNSLLTVISGNRGNGKTTLALAAAHQLFRESKTSVTPRFGAFVWIDARYQNLSLDSLLNQIGIQLESPIITDDPEEKINKLRRVLSSKPSLIIVDNLDTLDDFDENVRYNSYAIIDFLESLPEASHAIVTTRYLSLKRGKIVLVGNFNQKESLEFIRAKAKRMNLGILVNAPDETLIPIHISTSGSPLAIEWAIGQIYAGNGIDEVVNRLRGGSADIFENLFGGTWSMLKVEEKEILLDLTVARTSFGAAAIKHISRFDNKTTETVLIRLVKLMFVEASESIEQDNIRYSLHPLTHLFVLEHSNEFPGELGRACEASVNYYVEFVRSQGEDAKAVEAEVENIIYLISWSENNKKWELIMNLMDVLFDILLSLGYFEERVNLGLLAAKGAEISRHPEKKAHYLILSSIHAMIGQYATVEKILMDALNAATSQNNRFEVASVKKSLAYSYFRQGKIMKAAKELDGVELVIQNYENYNDIPNNHIDTLSLIGTINFYLGKYDEAMIVQKHMLEKCEKIGWERAKCYALRDIAELQMINKEYKESRTTLEKAFLLAEKYADKRQSARIQISIAKLLIRTGQVKEARERLNQAYIILDKLNMKNETEEIKAFINHINSKPDFFWILFSQFIKHPPVYAPEYPIGGD